MIRMPAFDFPYNIGDIVKFSWQDKSKKCGGVSRGLIKGILIGADKAGYMIETSNGDSRFVSTCDVRDPVYSTKSFDVIYPGLEVEFRRRGDKYPEAFIYAKVIQATIKDGRLFYQVESCNDGCRYMAPEGRIFLVQSKKNQNKFR